MNDAEMIQNQETPLDSALKTYQPGNLRRGRHHYVLCKLRKVHLPTIRHKLSGQLRQKRVKAIICDSTSNTAMHVRERNLLSPPYESLKCMVILGTLITSDPDTNLKNLFNKLSSKHLMERVRKSKACCCVLCITSALICL